MTTATATIELYGVNQMEKLLLSIAEAAQVINLSPWTVRAFIKSGKLRPVRLGRRVLLEPSELERLIQESKGNALQA